MLRIKGKLKVNIEETIKVNNKVILDFYADWCMPCKQMEPSMEEIRENTDIQVVKVNVDDEPELAQLYGIMSIPTLIYFKEGERIKDTIGAIPMATMIDVFA